MLSNKMLHINELYFNLPDDFNGTVGEAFKLLADYRLKAEQENKINHVIDSEEYDNYTKLMTDETIKCSFGYDFLKLNKDKNEWETFENRERNRK